LFLFVCLFVCLFCFVSFVLFVSLSKMGRMLFLFLAVTVFSVASADLSADCIFVRDTYLLDNITAVKNCFDTYVLNESFVDVIIRNLELMGNLYPYIEIDANPPQSSDLPFPVINYSERLEDTKSKLRASGNIVSKVFRPTMAFINGFHDPHICLRFGRPTGAENIFGLVASLLPFSWNVDMDDDNNTRILIGPDQYTALVLLEYYEFIEKAFANKIYVKSVDGKDPFDFFVGFFEEYDNMRFKQARISNAIKNTVNGFLLLSYPTEKLFENHTIVFEDNTTVPFSCLLVNQANPSPFRSDFLPVLEEPIRAWPNRDKEFAEIIRNFDFSKRSAVGNLEDHELLPCGLANNGTMNFITISSFSGSKMEQFITELKECVEFFYQNDKPITIWMNHNPGGEVSLTELAQLLLLSDIDPRISIAYRKTADSKRVFVDKGYGSLSANLSNKCLQNTNVPSSLSEVFADTEYDHYDGGLVHARTKKMFIHVKELAEQVYQFTKGKRLRNPTDIILVTDGFCASACGIFAYNTKRTGSAIIAGYGGTYPNDTKFVLGQLYATTIDTSSYCDEVADNPQYGLYFGVSFAEMYNISEDMKEVIPNDFDTPRIDFHLGYLEGASPKLYEILDKTFKLYEDSKTKCNPDNKNLIYVTEDCHVDDPNALAVGYVCGDDGFWNKSSCKILTCQPKYSLDYVANKCIPNICDGRPSSSSSSPQDSGSSSESCSAYVSPAFRFIMAFLFAIFSIRH